MVTVRLDSLDGEQVALETYRRLALEQRERVRQGEQDRVPPPIGRLEECPTVGDVCVDARVVVGPVRVGAADVEEVPVDLHGVHRGRPAGEGDGDVVARAGADDQDLPGRVGREALVHRLVERVADGSELQPGRDPVDLGDDSTCVGDRFGVNLVVRRPRRVLLRRLDAESDDEKHERHDDGSDLTGSPGPDGDEQADGGDRPPHHRFGIGERQDGERCHAEQRADEIELVGVEVAEPGERPGDAVPEAGHHCGDGNEDNGQDDPARRTRRVEAEEDEVATGDADAHVEHAGQDDEHGEHHRGEEEQRPGTAARPQESGADAEEAAEQHDVGEIGEVQDVGAEPADQGELDEQRQRGSQDELSAWSTSRCLCMS